LNYNTVVRVDFAELSDGSLVEMIEDPTDGAETLFAVYRNHCVRYMKEVDDQGRILAPLSRADHNLRHVRLAQGAESYGAIWHLHGEVSRILEECLDVDKCFCALMTAFAISTWLHEKLPVAPYLALVGPPGSGKTTAMRILNLLCYRALLTSDISSSAFYDISHRVHPTILLDETLTAGRPRELIHLLKASSTPDSVSLRKDKARLAYGPKVFSWLELPDDPALNSRCITVPMQRTSRTDLKSPNDAYIIECAKKLRMGLLLFRFERFRNVPVPKIPADVQLSARPLDLYRALALPFDQDEGMCSVLGHLIAEQNKFQARLLSPPQVSAIRVLYAFIHQFPNVSGLALKGLTAAVNTDLASRGESAGLVERKLGDILTSLSFTNRTRSNTGYGLNLGRPERTQIHATAREYGVEGTSSDLIDKCQICTPTPRPSPKTAPPLEEAPTGEQSPAGEPAE
jgi:hypothetical protein